ncbi:MAG: hypothetical protein ACLFXM_01145 [Acidimicrobiia bacterium]
MPEIEEQLRTYGDAFERRLATPPDAPPRAVRRHRPRRILLAAATAGTLLIVVAVLLPDLLGDDRSGLTTDDPSASGSAVGVFTTTTDVVLLVSDGIDGATAIDLDTSLAGRRVIEGERAGDQPFTLTLTGDHLVVGWGEIYAAPLSGAESRKIDDATIHLPAAEPGEVWTITWDGGRIGAGDATLRRVRVDGTVVFSSDGSDADRLVPLLGVPGGLAVETPDGVAVWDADTGIVGPVLGPGPVSGVTSDGRRLAWCEATCETWHVAELDRTGPPTAPHASSRNQIALAPDGEHLAVLRPNGGEADLVVVDLVTRRRSVEATSLDQQGMLHWTRDGGQLFYVERSYQQPRTRIGVYTERDGSWEARTVPVGGGLAAISLDREEARSFFTYDLVDPGDCPAPGAAYPSGRSGVCSFHFSASRPRRRRPRGPRRREHPPI